MWTEDHLRLRIYIYRLGLGTILNAMQLKIKKQKVNFEKMSLKKLKN